MWTTKFVLAFLSIVVLVQASPSDSSKKYEKCTQSFPVNAAVEKSLMEKGVLPDETDQTGRCLIQCILDDVYKVLDSKDVFDAVKAKKNIPIHGKCLFGAPGAAIPAQAVIDAAVDECGKTLTETATCMTNYKIWVCLVKKLRV